MIKTAKQLPLVQTGIALIRSLVRRSYHTATIRLYRLELSIPAATPSSLWQVAINHLDDLDGYDPQAGWQSTKAFCQTAAERITRGETLFSISVEGTLAHYGWLISPARTIAIPEVQQTYELPAGSAYLYDFFTHPAYRNRGMYQASMQRSLAHLQTLHCTAAYIGVDPSNLPSCRAIERLGFTPAATLGYRRIANQVRRWVAEPSRSGETEL